MTALRSATGRRSWAGPLVVVVALLALPVGLAGPAAAQTDGARDIGRFACPADLEQPFSDVEGSTHEEAIGCVAAYLITQGTGEGRYSPSELVTRGQMASFVFRALLLAEVPMDIADRGFTDVDGNVHEESINGIASVGVANGTSSTTFSPELLVNRAQMASFIARALELDQPLDEGGDAFTDDDGGTHEANIDKLAEAGIVEGTGDGRYEPDQPVSRASMAAFVARALDLAAERLSIRPLGFREIGITALTPGAETTGGQEGASGSSFVALTAIPGVLCYDVAIHRLEGEPTAMHVHEAPRGEDGPPRITLPVPYTEDVRGSDDRCIDGIEPDLLQDIEDDPGSFYVNVHTEEQPDGAIRGQLATEEEVLVTTLSGDAEVPGPGDDDGAGVARLSSTSEDDIVCFFLAVLGTEEVTAAHVHDGTRDESGPVVIPLRAPDETGVAGGCIGDLDPTVVAAIVETPSDFYVNAHTADFPDGAVRGQLVRRTFTEATLAGENEVPGPGDDDGEGSFSGIVVSQTTICYQLEVTDVEGVTAAHIHEGDPDEAGDVVVPLEAPVDGSSAACATDLDPVLVDRIAETPSDFYVNVHSDAHPDGAVRGQLARVDRSD